MSSASQPSPVAGSWIDDARALILMTKDDWTDDRPLAEKMASTLLAPGAHVGTLLRDKVVVAALARGDARSVPPMQQLEMAMREGVRGYLWLPNAVDANFEVDGFPQTSDDIAVVSKGASINRRAVMQRQCWAGLRRGRAMGVEFKRSTARQYGWEEKELYADRLVADLDGFFSDEEALEQFAVEVVPFTAQQERFKGGPFVTTSLQSRLRRVAEQLRRLPPYYPDHLTPIELAKSRRVVKYKPTRDLRGEDSLAARPAAVTETGSAIHAMEGERRVVLLGDPGSGKSTLARAVVLRELEASERAVAVYVSAPILARALVDTTNPWLDVFARCALALPLNPPAAEECRELVGHLETSRHCFVVLDGIDEVFDVEQRHIIDEVVRGLEGVPGRTLITSRVIGYRQRSGWRELRTLPLQDSFESLLENWYGKNAEAAARALAAYKASAHVRDLVTSPVLAGMVAALAADPTADLSSGEGALYRQAVTRLSERRWKNPHHPARSESGTLALLDAYSDAAWVMAGIRSNRLVGQWESVTSYRALRQAGVDVEALRGNEMLIGHGATETDADVDAPWTWLHRSLADYFVGARLLEMYRAGEQSGELLLEETAQYPEAWYFALKFVSSLATPAERQAMARRLRKLSIEGDPGGALHRTIGLIDEASSHDEVFWEEVHRNFRARIAGSGALWERFASEPFPQNARSALELDELFSRGRALMSPTDDAILAVWYLDRTDSWSGLEVRDAVEPPGELLDRSIDGEFGGWAALNVALIDAERAAARPKTRSLFADIGLRCADYCGLPSPIFYRPVPEDEDSCLSTIERFTYADINDPWRVVEMLDALAQVDGRDSGSLLLQVVLLRQQLEPHHSGVVFGYGGALVTDEAGFVALLVHAVATVIKRNWSDFARVALNCRRAGMPLRSSLITPLPYGASAYLDQETRLQLLEWAADEGPQELDAFAPILDDTDEQFIQAVFDRLEERARGAQKFVWSAGSELRRVGRLHHWRTRLLELHTMR